MHIGMIVYSKTGNTLFVAEKIKEQLEKGGNTVELVSLKPKGEIKPDAKSVEFDHLPDVNSFDALIFGGPVHAFSLAMPMKSCFDQIGQLSGKKVAVFATQHLFKWMGGNRSVGQLKSLAQAKGGQVQGTGLIQWKKEDRRQQQIKEVVTRFSKVFK